MPSVRRLFAPVWEGISPARVASISAFRHAERFAWYPSGFVACCMRKSEYKEDKRPRLEAG